ncbi:hypothetical protein LXL04_037157 [Taraxacum kok-saghyz]
MFRQWGIAESSVTNMRWNISGELCSGAALDDSFDTDGQFNPAIKCDCAIPNSTTCHITRLKVYAMNARGTIPEGLWTLTYLNNLNLGQNYLTGPLSPSIGNLTRMHLTFGINALSGQVPRELGLLTDLRSLSINSAGLGGEIPNTFANLVKMETVWASDNNFTGRIPDFIGNWSQLRSLRISGLSNGNLCFIKDLKSLIVLSLWDSRISGSIPSDIEEYVNLTRFACLLSFIFMDLSYNNLSGTIPRGLFNLSELSFLFLGNNSLSGTLPDVKSRTLANMQVIRD